MTKALPNREANAARIPYIPTPEPVPARAPAILKRLVRGARDRPRGREPGRLLPHATHLGGHRGEVA